MRGQWKATAGMAAVGGLSLLSNDGGSSCAEAATWAGAVAAGGGGGGGRGGGRGGAAGGHSCSPLFCKGSGKRRIGGEAWLGRSRGSRTLLSLRGGGFGAPEEPAQEQGQEQEQGQAQNWLMEGGQMEGRVDEEMGNDIMADLQSQSEALAAGGIAGADGVIPTGAGEQGTAMARGGGNAAPDGVVAPPTDKEYRTAVLKTVVVVLSAVAFGIGVLVVNGRQSALEFFAGYLVEQSLSVDNLFVFILLFEYFKVPAKLQSRVLSWGIIGAVGMRAVMIGVGVAAIQRFRSVILLFAAILIVSSVKLLTEKESHEDELGDNMILKVSRYFVKSVDYYDEEKFFTFKDGAKRATPLLLCLVCIELTDFVFAVDSIPAVMGVSKDPMIIFASNVFAIAALRSLYTLVAHAITDLPYLKPAVALVLGFVGTKMAFEYFHYEIDIALSLSIVMLILGGGTFMSIYENRRGAVKK